MDVVIEEGVVLIMPLAEAEDMVSIMDNASANFDAAKHALAHAMSEIDQLQDHLAEFIEAVDKAASS